LYHCLLLVLPHPATPELYPLSLHDALPISLPRYRRSDCPTPRLRPSSMRSSHGRRGCRRTHRSRGRPVTTTRTSSRMSESRTPRSEEHTSELQSRENLVCRLLLEKKKKTQD